MAPSAPKFIGCQMVVRVVVTGPPIYRRGIIATSISHFFPPPPPPPLPDEAKAVHYWRSSIPGVQSEVGKQNQLASKRQKHAVPKRPSMLFSLCQIIALSYSVNNPLFAAGHPVGWRGVGGKE